MALIEDIKVPIRYPDRFWILEPHLQGWGAHYLHYASSCSAGWLKATGSAAHLLVASQCSPAVVNYLESIDCKVHLLPQLSSYGRSRELTTSGEVFSSALEHIDGMAQLTHDDLIFVPTAGAEELYGAACFLQRRPPRRRPTISLLFHQEHRMLGLLEVPTTVGASVREVKDALNIWTTSADLGNEPTISTLVSQAICVLPVPSDTSYENQTQIVPLYTEPLRCGFLGLARPSKGILLLLSSVAAAAHLLPRVSFILQLGGFKRYYQSSNHELYDKISILETLPNVSIVEQELPPAEFSILLNSMDLLLLPYHPLEYRNRVSGIFVLGAALGKPLITTAGTSMARSISVGSAAGVTFTWWPQSLGRTVEAFTNALLHAHKAYPTLRDRAIRYSCYWSNWDGQQCVRRLSEPRATRRLVC